MKELTLKVTKWISAVILSLAGIFGVGWTAAMTLNVLFKTSQVEAEARFRTMVGESEAKIMAVRNSDMDGLNGKIDVLARTQDTMLKLNHEILKEVRSHR